MKTTHPILSANSEKSKTIQALKAYSKKQTARATSSSIWFATYHQPITIASTHLQFTVLNTEDTLQDTYHLSNQAMSEDTGMCSRTMNASISLEIGEESKRTSSSFPTLELWTWVLSALTLTLMLWQTVHTQRVHTTSTSHITHLGQVHSLAISQQLLFKKKETV